MEIYRALQTSRKLTDGIARLLTQLSSSAAVPTDDSISELLADKNTYLFVAEEDGIIVGTLTLIVTNIPTGRKAWIEDVVVDEAFRGQNIGAKLVAEAMAAATTIGARKIYLTSNPSRKAAHALYKKCGFEEYDTTVFRVNVPK